MDPYLAKQTIKETQEQFSVLRQNLLNYIKRYVDTLNAIPHPSQYLVIAANRLPFTLTLSQLNVFQVNLDTSNGVKIILADQETEVPIDNLPLEDLLQLYKKIYYQ